MERAGKPRHRWQDPTDEGESADSARVRAFGVGALARECSELGVGFPSISAFENPGRLLANSFGVASHPLRQLVSFRQVVANVIIVIISSDLKRWCRVHDREVCFDASGFQFRFHFHELR
jgi:hypothetical protein